MVWGLKEGLVECATVCIKSEVILLKLKKHTCVKHRDACDECEKNKFKFCKVFLKNLSGGTRTYHVDLNSTVYEMKLRIQMREGILPDKQR